MLRFLILKTMFSIKFASDSLKICYIDSLYRTHQYGGDYKLICSKSVCIFGCFLSVFTLKDLTWEYNCIHSELLFLCRYNFILGPVSNYVGYLGTLCYLFLFKITTYQPDILIEITITIKLIFVFI